MRSFEQSQYHQYFHQSLWYELQAKRRGVSADAVYLWVQHMVASQHVVVDRLINFRGYGDAFGKSVAQLNLLFEDFDSLTESLPKLGLLWQQYPPNLADVADTLWSWKCTYDSIKYVEWLLDLDANGCSTYIEKFVQRNGILMWSECTTAKHIKKVLFRLRRESKQFEDSWRERHLPTFIENIDYLLLVPLNTLIELSDSQSVLITGSEWLQKQESLPELWRIIEYEGGENEELRQNGVPVGMAVLKKCLRSVSVFMENISLRHTQATDPCLNALPPLSSLEELEKLWFDAPAMFGLMPCLNCEYVSNFCHFVDGIVKQLDEFIACSFIDYSQWSKFAPAMADYVMIKIRSHLRIVLELYNYAFQSFLFPIVEQFKAEKIEREKAVWLGDGWWYVALGGGEAVSLEAVRDIFLVHRLDKRDIRMSANFVVFFSNDSEGTSTFLGRYLGIHVDKTKMYTFTVNPNDHRQRQPMFTAINTKAQRLHQTLLDVAWRLVNTSRRYYHLFEMFGKPGDTMNWYGFVANFVVHVLELPGGWGEDCALQVALVSLILDWMRLKCALSITDPRYHRWAVTALCILRRCILRGYVEKAPTELIEGLLRISVECTGHLGAVLEILHSSTSKTTLPSVSIESLSNIDRLRELHDRNSRLIGRVIDRNDGVADKIQALREVKPKLQKIASIGRGSTGQVYEAIDLETGSLVAVKEIQSGGLEIARVKEEADMLKRLSHPNILEYYGVSLKEDTLSIITEFCSGGSLHRQIQFGPIHDERLLKNYCYQILSGLQYIHARAIIHRDIKPANILIDRHGVLKLADFGSIGGTSSKGRKSPTMVGTPAYMAPETVIGSQAANAYPISTKSDIWSFGCTVLFAITGRRPWHDFDNDFAILYQLGSTSNLPTMPVQFLVPADCADMMMACLRRNPAERPSAQVILEEHKFLRNPSSFKYYY